MYSNLMSINVCYHSLSGAYAMVVVLVVLKRLKCAPFVEITSEIFEVNFQESITC